MLRQIQNLPFAVKKIMYWILNVTTAYFVGSGLWIVIALITLPALVFLINLFGLQYSESIDVLDIWVLSSITVTPILACLGSVNVTRKTSQKLKSFLFVKKKNRTTF